MVPLSAILALLSLAMAPPIFAAPLQASLSPRSSGRITWYHPGLGACGETSADGDAIAAVSSNIYDAQHPCARRIRVSHQGRSVNVRVVDRCAGCAANDLDLSPSAFQEVVGGLDQGRTTATWEWL